MSYQQHLAQVANDLLIDQEKIDAFVAPDEQSFIKPASDFEQQFIHGKDEGDSGAYLPWQKTRDRVRLRPGELSYWAGYKGHKKSMMTSEVALSLIDQNHSVCIASFEMKVMRTLQRMSAQCIGNQNPTEEAQRKFFKKIGHKLYLYDQQGIVPTQRVIKMVEYCAYELGIEHIFIDSLMKCGMNPDDYAGQKKFCDRLDAIAKDTGAHIHLVLHMRKPPNDKRFIPDGYDIAGGNDVTNQASNIFVVWSDTEKEEESKKPKDKQEKKIIERSDCILRVANQRNAEYEGRMGFYFNTKSLQFTEQEGGYTRTYL